MSGRCKSCDSALTADEMIHKDKYGNYSELCFSCLYADYNQVEENFRDYPTGLSSDEYT